MKRFPPIELVLFCLFIALLIPGTTKPLSRSVLISVWTLWAVAAGWALLGAAWSGLLRWQAHHDAKAADEETF